MSDEDPAFPTDPELCDACRIARSWYQSRGRLCRFHAIERLRQLEDPEQKFRYAVERKGNAEAGDPDRAMSVRLVLCHACGAVVTGFTYTWPTGGAHCFKHKDSCPNHNPDGSPAPAKDASEPKPPDNPEGT